MQFSDIQVRKGLVNSKGAIIDQKGFNGAGLILPLHAKYTKAVLEGRVFSVANQAAKSTTAALNTTWTGLAIANPTTSQVNVSLIAVGVAQVADGVAGAVGLLGVASVSGLAAELTPINRLLGGPPTGVIADTEATITAPALIEVFGNLGSLATTGYGLTPGLMRVFDGSLVLPPGTFVGSYTTGATTDDLIWSFLWEEIPIATD